MAIPAIPVAPTFVPKMEPVRQPMGPPCPVDELGPLNFASRLGKRAVGGLGVLADARERREVSAAMASEVVVY
ncbi:hypothetical protein FRB99_003872 [Tulasnella sp. 403]|nr:hypothetical protein FRB99_003872 [Tulasnella sp. 403]